MEKHGTAIYALGQYNEVLVAITRALPNALAGTDPKRVISAVQNGEAFERVLSEMLRLFLNSISIVNSHLIVVDYDMSIEETIKLGKYGEIGPHLTSQNFPTERKGKAEIKMELIQFNRSISTEEVLKELDQMGYRPTELKELSALGAMCPDLQKVIALGSVLFFPTDGSHHAPAFTFNKDGKRSLNIYWLGNNWSKSWRFAAVHK